MTVETNESEESTLVEPLNEYSGEEMDGFENPESPVEESPDAVEDESVDEEMDSGPEEEGSVQEPVVETPEEVAEVPEFSDDLLTDIGITKDEAIAQGFTEKTLQMLVDRQYQNLNQQGANFRSGQQQTQQNAPEPWKLPDVQLPEEYSDDEDTAKLVKHLNDHNSANIAPIFAQQQQLIEQLLADRTSSQFNSYVNEFDQGLQKLGDEWTPVFGKGVASEVAANSIQGQNRQYLDETMTNISQARASQNLSSLSISDLQRHAARVAFPDFHDKTITQTVQTKANKRQGQFTNPPTRAGDVGSTPETRAVNNLGPILKRMGHNIQEGDTGDHSGMEV